MCCPPASDAGVSHVECVDLAAQVLATHVIDNETSCRSPTSTTARSTIMTEKHRGVPLIHAATLAVAMLPLQLFAQDMKRPDVMGREGAVVSDHALASAAGAAVLRNGGNAIDAAITMAAVLAVVRPHMNGVGGDNFLLIRDAKTNRVYALNGSGRAGANATPALFASRELKQVPGSGIMSVSVPGAVKAWEDALKRFGTIKLSAALQPAIGYAEHGFPVSTRLSRDIEGEARKVGADSSLKKIFLADGQAPKPGTILRQTDLARTLRAIADRGADA